MLKKLIAFVIISLVFMNYAIPGAKAAEVFSADQFPYEEMQVQVMPEFDYPEKWPKDQPSLLVAYYGTFTNKTGKDFNGTIEFPVPVNDKNFEIYLLAEFPSDKEPEIQRPLEINKEKGVVTWKPSKAIAKDKTYRFVVEYYINPFEVADGNKKFAFNYTYPTDIKKLDVVMYSPLDAKEFKIDPVATNTSESDYGEKLYFYQYTNVKKGESLNLNVSYVKKDNKSTLSAISAKQPPKDDTHSGVDGKTATEQVNGNDSERPIIGVAGASIIGVSIIIAAAFVFFGLKGNALSSKPNNTNNNVNTHKKANKTQAAKGGKKDSTEEKKKLRAQLMNGQIDEATYEKEVKKLN